MAVQSAWYDLRNIPVRSSSKGDREGLYKAMESVDQTIRQLFSEEAILPHRVILGGFSQGAALALFCALNLPYTVRGVLNLSGWLEFSAEYPLNSLHWGSKRDMSMFFMHGQQDKIAPVFLHSHATELLTAAGFHVKSMLFDMDHTFDVEQGVHIRRWLLKSLPRKLKQTVEPARLTKGAAAYQQMEGNPIKAHRALEESAPARAASAAITSTLMPTTASDSTHVPHGGEEWARAASAAAAGAKRGRVDSQDGYAALALVQVPLTGEQSVHAAQRGALGSETRHKPATLPAAFKASDGMWVSRLDNRARMDAGIQSRGTTAELWGLNQATGQSRQLSLPSAASSKYSSRGQSALDAREAATAASTYSGRQLVLGPNSVRSPLSSPERSPLVLAAGAHLSPDWHSRDTGMSGVRAPKFGREKDVRDLLDSAGSFSSLQIDAGGFGDLASPAAAASPGPGSMLAWPMPVEKRPSKTAMRKRNADWAMAGPRNGPSDAGLVYSDRATTPGTLHNQQMMMHWNLTPDLMPGASRGSYMTATPMMSAGSRRSRRSSRRSSQSNAHL